MKRKSSDHSHNRTSYRWLNLTTSCVVTVALVCAPMGTLLANPVDGVVSAGSASIASNGATTTITQGTDRAVIDWRGFDIAAGETTRFVQPSASSMTLNRVNSNSASFINGNLTANGNLILVNPNGVWFGANARVDVNGLIASTADIGNAAFMNSTGELAFDKPGNPNGFVVNEGLITAKEAGLVGLVAPNVINSGVIAAKLGRVHLASGDTATVDMYGDGLIRVAVSDDVKSQLAENSGIIAAEGGTIAMTAAAGKDIVNSLVHVAGELHAPSISQKNGKIIIAAEGSNAVAGNVAAQKGKKSGSSNVVVEGTLNASGRKSGERGGSVTVTGDNIALLDGTLIDASGSDGASGTTFGQAVSAYRARSAGGDIRIGGDYLGGGDTPAANNLYVSTGALVLNDALNNGDAGRTIFWSDNTTQFYGNVYARALGGKPVDVQTWNAIAGGNTGDGGFVETSGHHHLDVGGYVDLTSSNGARGTYFLDPTNITIYGNFAPTNISGLTIWVDASNAGSITQTAGSVTSVQSLVNGYVATKNGAGTVTTGAHTQNGLNVFDYNGTADLQFSGINLGSNVSVFGLVLSTGATWNNNGVIAASRGGNGYILHANSGSASLTYYNVNGVGTYNSITSQTPASITNFTLYEMGLSAAESFYGTNSALTIGAGQSRGGSAVSNNVAIGGDDCCGTRFLNGQYAEFFLYNSYLTANERLLLAQYQSAKWGIALTPPGSGATEVAQATASVQKGDAVDGYSVFTTRYLERLSQSANISLQSSNNITLDLQGDTLNFATAGRSLTLTAGNQITTASTGAITTNNGAVSLYANDSIVFSNAFTINTNGGAVLMNADRDASGVGSISLTGVTINTGGGALTMGGGSGTISAGSGYAVGNATNENGILVTGGSLNAAGGNIIMNGQSRVTTTSFISGVSLDSAAAISTNNSGTINIYGLGNTGTGTSNRGVRIVNGSTVTAQNGNITINGTGGGSTTAANNYGVFIGGSGGYISTNGSGSINVTGTGGNTGGSGGVNYGVYITNAGSYIKTTNTGSITITGTKGGQSSSYGILTDIINAIVTSGSSGNITLTADSISLSGASGSNYNVSSVGSLTVAPLTAVTMGVGSGAGTFTFTDTQISYTSAASYIFGSAAGGNLTINTARDFVNKNVSFISGGSITLSGNLTKATGTGTANYLFQAGTDIVNSGSAGISATTGAINLTFDANYAGAGGAISLSGGTISTNGGSIIMGGGSSGITAGSGFAVGGSTYQNGITIGNTLNAAGGTIIINGRGYATPTASNYGVNITGAIQNTSGTTTITGTTSSNYSGGYNFGVSVSGTITTNTGDLTINGTNTSTAGAGGNNTGIGVGGTISSTGAGKINLNGTSSATGGSNGYGIRIGLTNGSLSSLGGDITLTGISSTSVGVFSTYTNTISLNGNAKLYIIGTGSGGSPGFQKSGAGISAITGTNAANDVIIQADSIIY